MRTTLKPRIIGVLVSLLLLCCCATGKPARSQLPADVAFNKDAGRGGWVIVMLQLENGEQLPVLLDTGAPWTFFDKSREPKLGQRLDSGTAWNFGTKRESGVYAAPKLYLGGTLLTMTGTTLAPWITSRYPVQRHRAPLPGSAYGHAGFPQPHPLSQTHQPLPARG